MIKIEIERLVDISAQIVWDEMRHFDRVLRWVPGGAQSTIQVTGEGVGAVRDITLVTQGYVQHQLVAFDGDNMSFSYKLTAGKPIGMQDYVVVAKVIPVNEKSCLIRWAGEMNADKSLDERAVGHALEIALGNMVTGLIALLKQEPPSFLEQPNESWQLQR